MKWSLGAQGSLEWPWGSPDRLQGSPEGAQGFPGEVPRAAQGIPRELGFPEGRDSLAGWMAGLVGLARWKARWAAKNLFGVLCWGNIYIYIYIYIYSPNKDGSQGRGS